MRVVAFVNADHADTIFNRADEPAEIAAHALMLIDFGNAAGRSCVRYSGRVVGPVRPAGSAVHVNALVCAIPAGRVAKLAADALVRINTSNDFVIEIEMLPVGHLRQRETANGVKIGVAFGIHPMAEAIDHILHDTKAVVHGRGTSLQSARS